MESKEKAASVKQNIYQAISKCMEDIGTIGKDSKNNAQGFKYRGIDAVMNALSPALIKNHIFVVPQILEQIREERKSGKGNVLIYSICKIKYTFYAEDGSYIEAITIGEGMDSGDKATNKAMAIAFKYACFQVFCIPTEEMKDPDAECHDVLPKENAKDSRQVKSDYPYPNDFVPASAEQIGKITDFVAAYAEVEGRTSHEIYAILKKKFNYKSQSDISSDLADKIVKQLEYWYQKKRGTQ